MRMGADTLACRSGRNLCEWDTLTGGGLPRTDSRPTTRASPSISSKNAARPIPASLPACHGRSALLYISCFPSQQSETYTSVVRESHTHEMSALPLVICSVCAYAPRLTEPPVPPTLRQMEHTQSWYGTGVLDWTVKATAPQWQLPLSSTGMTLEGC